MYAIRSYYELLRVLQEKVVDEVGGDRPIPVDVRILVATNRDLLERIREGTFRITSYNVCYTKLLRRFLRTIF